MSLNIVTGIGPRVGSSFVMQQCKAKGLFINGTKFLNGLLPKEGNPLGYYDLLPWDVAGLKKGVAKVWPISLPKLQVPIKNMVILRRKNLDDQIQSCIKQAKREPVKINSTCEELVLLSEVYLEEWLSRYEVNYRFYYTEDLNSSIDEIVTFLGE